MKILFLSRWFPYPTNNGSKLRIYNLVRGLAKNHEIFLVTFATPDEVGPVPAELTSICQEIQVVPWKPFDPESATARQGFFSPTPRSILDTFSPDMVQAISQIIDRAPIDLVIASQIDTAAYSSHFAGLPAIFEEAELGVIYEKYSQAHTMNHKIRSGLTWAKYRRYLNSLVGDFNIVTVVSDQENALWNRAVPNTPPVHVIPNCVDVDSYRNIGAEPSGQTMVFIGSLRFRPNHEGMKWFIQEVLPIIQSEVSEASLIITGDHGDLPLPPGEHITRTGMVPDIRPLVAGAWLSVVPIWEGGGTRLKILESMAMRTPVVATSKGVEGIDALNGKEVLIGDTPEKFAEQAISILTDPIRREHISELAFQLVNSSYNWEATIPQYEELISLAAARTSTRNPATVKVTTDSIS